LDSHILFSAVEEQDIDALKEFFNELEKEPPQEVERFIEEFHTYYTDKYGTHLLSSDEYKKQLEYHGKVYQQLLKGNQGYPFSRTSLQRVPYIQPIWWWSKKKEDKEHGITITAGMVIGGVEIFTGALLWIIPIPTVRWAATAIFYDGVQRTFDNIENQATINEKVYNALNYTEPDTSVRAPRRLIA